MLEAVWTVRFRTDQDYGAGVAILDSGKVYGGDDQYLYVGTYALDANTGLVTASVLVRLHTRVPGRASVFGTRDKFDLELSGPVARDRMVLTGKIVNAPTGQIIRIAFQRQEELPLVY